MATVPPLLVALGTLPELCFLPLLGHVLILFFLHMLSKNARIPYDYFTPSRIEEIAKRVTRKELDAPLGPKDLKKGIFLIKIKWQYDSMTSGLVTSLFISLVFLPTLILDLGLSSPIYLIICGMSAITTAVMFSTGYTENSGYRPSEHDVLIEDVIPLLNPERRRRRRGVDENDSPPVMAMKIRIHLDEELKKYESGEKERPPDLEKIINRKTPPPYRVR